MTNSVWLHCLWRKKRNLGLSNRDFDEELMETFGFIKVYSKNEVMTSYKKGEVRLDHYFTTGTVTLQGQVKQKVYYDIHSDEEIEDIICKIN